MASRPTASGAGVLAADVDHLRRAEPPVVARHQLVDPAPPYKCY
jgi:hypothetical protein